MSQQEDDLRALAKIMDFLRAVSIILVVMNVYWFCYEVIRLWGVNIGVVDRILLNFDRTAGLFHSILYTKLFAVLLLALSCLGTKGVKGEKITWGRIWTALAAGSVLFFLNWWILALPLPIEAVMGLYDDIVNPKLLVRRITLVGNRLVEEARAEAEEQYEQLELFTDTGGQEEEKKQEELRLKKERSLQEAMLSVKKKYGKNAMLKGMNLQEGATAMERNSQIGGHKA